MSEMTEISYLINLIYDCAAAREDWTVALKRTARFLSARDFALATCDIDSRQEGVISLPIDPDYLRSYMEHWGRRNFLWNATAILPLGQIFTFDAAMPREQFFRTELYNEWFRPQQLDRALGANVLADGSLTAVATFYRPASAPDFDDRDIARFQALAPHFQRAMQMKRELQSVQSHPGDIPALLEAFRKPTILTDSDARVLFANSQAEQIIRKKYLRMNGSRTLFAGRTSETARLSQLVATAARAATRQAGGKMVISRESAPSFVLTVTPLPGASYAKADRLALIFIDDPTSQSPSPPDFEILKDQFGLTYAEARLVAALLCGETLRSAAAKSGVTLETERSHLARIFQKTGAHSQSALMRLLRNSGHEN